MIVTPGTCRICGCTDTNPCVLRFEDEDHQEFCVWLDLEHTLCSNPLCVGAVPLAELLEMPIQIAA
jgi:hypothetical protein